MKKNMKSSSILLGGLFLLGAVCSCTQTAPDYASYVNPFIGTGGHGHTYPGAVVPNGMIQPAPTRVSTSGMPAPDITMQILLSTDFHILTSAVRVVPITGMCC